MRIRQFGFMLGLIFAVDSAAHRALAAHQSLLPSQQRILPRGKEVDLGLFPSGMAMSSDGRFLFISNNGFIFQSLTVVDTETLKTTNRRFAGTGSKFVFLGVALSPDGRTGYASGHNSSGKDVIHTITIQPGPKQTFTPDIPFPTGGFPAGMAITRDGR